MSNTIRILGSNIFIAKEHHDTLLGVLKAFRPPQ